jgi:hypothetical protein
MVDTESAEDDDESAATVDDKPDARDNKSSATIWILADVRCRRYTFDIVST